MADYDTSHNTKYSSTIIVIIHYSSNTIILVIGIITWLLLLIILVVVVDPNINQYARMTTLDNTTPNNEAPNESELKSIGDSEEWAPSIGNSKDSETELKSWIALGPPQRRNLTFVLTRTRGLCKWHSAVQV